MGDDEELEVREERRLMLKAERLVLTKDAPDRSQVTFTMKELREEQVQNLAAKGIRQNEVVVNLGSTYCDAGEEDSDFNPTNGLTRYFSNSQKLLRRRKHDYTPDGLLRKKTRIMNLAKSSRHQCQKKNRSLQKLHEHLNTSVVESAAGEGSNFSKMRQLHQNIVDKKLPEAPDILVTRSRPARPPNDQIVIQIKDKNEIS